MKSQHPKSMFIAVVLSALACPGAGQLYYRRYIRGGIMVALSLGAVTAVMYKTWTAMFNMMMTMPPEDAFGSLFAIAHAIMEENSAFFNWATIAFTVVWVAGIIDAFFAPKGTPENGGR